MSQENVEIAARAADLFNARDIIAFTALTTPDFEWSPSMGPVEAEIFRGAVGIRAYFASLGESWDEFRIVPESFRVGDQLVLLIGRLEAQGKGSGVPVDAQLGMLFELRDGTISRIRGFLDHGEALRTAGLAE